MNFLVGFGSHDISILNLLAMSVPVEDPAGAYGEYQYNRKLVRIYDSQPITFADGVEISFDTLNVKIADFGAGLSRKE